MNFFEKRTNIRVLSVILAALMMVVCFALAGCTVESEKKAFTFTDEIGGNYIIEYTYLGDVVLAQYQKYTLSFEGLDSSIEDVVRSNAESISAGYEDFDYIKYKYSIENGTFTEEVTIDDISNHIKEIAENNFMPIDGAEDADYISMKQTEEALLAGGWRLAE